MSASRYRDYVAALDAASELAQREFREIYDRLDKSKPVECKEILLEVVPAIVEKYGNIAALAAAEYYEAERREALGGWYKAELASPVDAEAVRAKVRYALGHLFEEK